MSQIPLPSPVGESWRSQSGVSATQNSTRRLLGNGASSSSRTPAPEAGNVAQEGAGTVLLSANKSEGKFEPKARDVQQRQVIERPFDFESTIIASIIHFHRISEDRMYFVRGEPNIQELVFESNPAAYMASPKREQPSENPDLRWIHLPANNMSWIQGVVTRIYAETNQQARGAPAKTPIEKAEQAERLTQKQRRRRFSFDVINTQGMLQTSVSDGLVKPYLLLRPDLWEGRQWRNDVVPRSVQGRFLRPVYSKISTDIKRLSDQGGLFLDEDASRSCVLFMPYIHWERVAMYHLQNRCLLWMAHGGHPDKEVLPAVDPAPQPSAQRPPPGPQDVILKNQQADTSKPWNREEVEKMAKSPEFQALSSHAKLLLAYVYEDLPLHVRRTLDQSYYHTLTDEEIRKRDLDQVLFRYTYKTLGNGVASRILMVDQLWLWVIDEPGKTKTVLTAFPPRWHVDPGLAREDPTDVYSKVFRALTSGDAGIFSYPDLISLIIDKCSGLFHPGVNEADPTINYLETFSVAIAALADAQTRQATIIKNCSDRLVALQARKDQLSGASLKEWVFSAPSGELLSTQKELDKRRPVSSQRQKSKTSTQEPKPADESKQGIKAWFQEVSEQEISPPDPLADLAALLQTHSRLQLDHEIEKQMNDLINIAAENDSFIEIKDILDELNSISHIFKQQIKLLEDMVAEHSPRTSASTGNARGSLPTTVPAAEDPPGTYSQLLATLRRRAHDFEDQATEATRVYDAICDILDLKQKQATVLEAFSSRQDAKESARQGQIILIFTIVTIIFLPLSFVAAIFSMNTKEINGLGNRSLNDVWRIMYPTMVAVVVLSLVVAFFAYIWWVIVGMFGILGRLSKMLLRGRWLRRSKNGVKGPGRLARSSTAMSGALRTVPGKGMAGKLPGQNTSQEKEDEDLYGANPLAKPGRRVKGKSATPNEKPADEGPTGLYRSGKPFFYDSTPAPRNFFARSRRNRDVDV